MRLLAGLTVCLAAAALSCAGAGGREAVPLASRGDTTPVAAGPAAGFRLPRPSRLEPELSPGAGSRSASYLQADLLRQAEDLDPSLPRQLVTATPNGATFAPDWDTAHQSFSGLSFAVYRFTLPGYDLNASLEYSWITDPGDAGNVFLGLADWNADRWDWFQAGADERVVLGSLAPYFDPAGNLLACILLTGTSPGELDWLRVGGLPPAAALTASASYGFVPLSVSFDASGSTDPDDAIVEYQWDPEGDGTFGNSTGTDPHFDWQYTSGADYHAAVRVIDTTGVYGEAQAVVHAAGDHSQNFGTAAVFEAADATVVLGDGSLLVFGAINMGVKDDVLVARISPYGTLEFAYSWGGFDNDAIADAVLSSDGFVYACGSSYSYSGPILQKWTQDGQLLWSKCYVSDGGNRFSSIAMSGTDTLYVAGLFAQNYGRGSLAQFDSSGNPVWWELVGDDTNRVTFSDMALHYSVLQGLAIRCSGSYFQSDSDPFYATFDPSGNLTSAIASMAAGTQDFCTAIISPPGLTSGVWVVGTSYGTTGDVVTFLDRIGAGAVTISEPGSDLWSSDLAFSGGLRNVLVSRQEPTSPYSRSIAYLGFDSALALISAQLFGTDGTGCVPYHIADYGLAGIVISGYSKGLPPGSSTYQVDVAARTMAWTDVATTVTSFSTGALDTPLDLQDVSGIVLNRDATEGDAMLIFKNVG